MTVRKATFKSSALSLSLFSRENGEFEEVIVLPSNSRLSPPEGEEEEEQQQQGRVPVVAFRENGLLKPLSGIEDISAQQGPGQLLLDHLLLPHFIQYSYISSSSICLIILMNHFFK